MNRTTCVGAADIAVIISSLMHHVLSAESSASSCAFRERVGELVDLADRLEDTSESDRHRLAIARSLLELSLPASAHTCQWLINTAYFFGPATGRYHRVVTFKYDLYKTGSPQADDGRCLSSSSSEMHRHTQELA